jgi:hypothetical protein
MIEIYFNYILIIKILKSSFSNFLLISVIVFIILLYNNFLEIALGPLYKLLLYFANKMST